MGEAKQLTPEVLYDCASSDFVGLAEDQEEEEKKEEKTPPARGLEDDGDADEDLRGCL